VRAVIQRVLEASVAIDGDTVSRIGPGLLVLLGVRRGDGESDVGWMAEKVANLRIFEDQAGKMNRSLLDEGRGAVLVVSQFTLYGDAHKGRRPSFIEACEPVEANRLYNLFCDQLRGLGLEVQTGEFAAHMRVALVNDGPVTLILDSP